MTRLRSRRAYVAQRLFDFSDKSLIAELRRVAALLPKAAPVTVMAFERHGRISTSALMRRFGTWPSALTVAGLASRIAPRGGSERRISEAACLANLELLWRHHGRQPVQRECYLPPSRIGGYIYNRRFGSWRRAIAAFLAWSKGGRRPPPKARAAAEEGTQWIPFRLRFAVYERDGFRCVACGASPANEPGVRLEIDHKQPRARGGTTTLDNLQTLCLRCNRGKGGEKGSETLPARLRASAARPGRRAGERMSGRRSG